jgi:hypothetical protein
MSVSQLTPGPLPPARRTAMWRAARRAVAALRAAHHEQTRMWEAWWQSSRAAAPQAGPLTWVRTLDGPRLAGTHLPVPGDAADGRP